MTLVVTFARSFLFLWLFAASPARAADDPWAWRQAKKKSYSGKLIGLVKRVVGPRAQPLRALDLKRGERIEGSSRHGGLQPDYVLDMNSAHFKPLLDFSTKTGGNQRLGRWRKIAAIIDYVRTNVLINGEYNNPTYLKILAEHRQENNAAIPLSEYAKNHVGVCREHALITHFALKAAGVKNRFVYLRVKQGRKIESHAVVIVRDRGQTWVVDSYNGNFHGRRLGDLFRPGGVRAHDPIAPGVSLPEYDGTKAFMSLHEYPRRM